MTPAVFLEKKACLSCTGCLACFVCNVILPLEAAHATGLFHGFHILD
jgi:hypothetical protein